MFHVKQIALAAAVALSTATLGACTPDQEAQTAVTITQIQQDAKLACSYLPTATSVASIIGSFVPAVGSALPIATQIVGAICNAATKSGARRGAAAPIVITDGLGRQYPVEGKFVVKSGSHRRRR